MVVERRFRNRNLVLLQVVFSGVFAALVAVTTMLVQIPVPATKGYVNVGDVMIFVGGLMFGPVVGCFSGAVGSAIADVASGYGLYAPFTFAIKGIEGLIAGLISNGKNASRNVIAVTFGGIEMVVGYFLAEFFPLQLGWAALSEVPFNIVQVTIGGLVSVPLAAVVGAVAPGIWRNLRGK